MKQRIAIEPDLTPVRDFLTDKGYQVDSINFGEGIEKQQSGKYDAFVVTGLDTNFMGIQDRNIKAIVVSAAGLTPQQVYHELQLRLSD